MRYDDLNEKNKRMETGDRDAHSCGASGAHTAHGAYGGSFAEDATCTEDLAIIEALHSGIKANPEFRARLKREFMAEARADAERHTQSAAPNSTAAFSRSSQSAQSIQSHGRRGSNAKPRSPYSRWLPIAAAAAIIIVSLFATNLFKPAQPDATQLADTTSMKTGTYMEEAGNELLNGGEDIDVMLSGASEMKAMGFAPQTDADTAKVQVKLGSALTDDVVLKVEAIASQAGGSVRSSDDIIHMNIPSEVLDHVLANLSTELEIVDVSKPSEIYTETTCITLHFTAD